VGGVLTPEFLPGFSLTADYYDIKIDNAIGAVLPQATLDTCYVIVADAANPFCARIKRGPNGQLTAVDSSDVNVALLRVRGIDLGVRYGLDVSGGRATIDYAGDIVTSQSQKNGEAAQTVECAGRFGATCGLETRRALPKYRHRATVGWRGDDGFTLRGTWRMLGKVKDDSPTVFAVEEIGDQHYFDLAASIDVTRAFTLVLGVENLFDRKPPLAGTNAADANTFPASYDVIGRRFGVSVTVRQ
jgi:outer membrane receptor protein involved in Fe transport